MVRLAHTFAATLRSALRTQSNNSILASPQPAPMIQANTCVAISPRVEWFEDSDGFMTGTAQTLNEVTLTGEVTLVDNLLWRVEFRHDRSDVASFRTDRGAFVKTQNTIGFGWLYSFSTKP